MKKITAFVLILVLLLSLFSGVCQAENEKKSSDAFMWNGHSMRIEKGVDDGTVICGNLQPVGRFIQIFVVCEDGTFTWKELSEHAGKITLSGSDGTVFNIAGYGFHAVEGSSMDVAALSTNPYDGFSPIFDVPDTESFATLTLLVKGLDGTESLPLAGLEAQEGNTQESTNVIPPELVGTWKGTGKPVGGGSAISLEFVINADGTGSYTFQQAGYQESRPVTLTSADASFSVDIPENDPLGATKCEGTYAYENGVLTLHITTTFSTGRQFEYIVECEMETSK